jgi:hypothetical protein
LNIVKVIERRKACRNMSRSMVKQEIHTKFLDGKPNKSEYFGTRINLFTYEPDNLKDVVQK